MDEFFSKVNYYVIIASQLLGALTVVASIIAQITPTPKDDKLVSKVSGYILAVIKWLPTIGINPNTKKIEDAYNEYSKKPVAKK